jgi:hypothetical protein
MVNVTGADVPPAVVTVTLTAPAVATRLAGIATGSVELPTRVAVRGVAPKFAIIGEVKLVPEMFSVKAPKPAGTRILPPVEVMIGGAGFTVKETPDEVPPAVTTEMLAVTGLAIRVAGTTALS